MNNEEKTGTINDSCLLAFLKCVHFGVHFKCSRPFILYRIKWIAGFIVEFCFIFTDRVAGIFFEHTV